MSDTETVTVVSFYFTDKNNETILLKKIKKNSKIQKNQMEIIYK